MGTFSGYLLKNGSNATIDKYIQFRTYKSTPNHREEIVAYRDDNTRDLYRETAEGTKSSVVFNTIDLDLESKKEIQKFFNDATTIALERKVQLTYWNDEDNEYKTTYFYIPDIDFTIIRITNDNIYYEPLEINLIEY